jgi:ferredoxin--NADP+ reductase
VVIGGILSAYKIAIVGAGPADYFTAQAFQNAQTDELTFTIDMTNGFEPHGY